MALSATAPFHADATRVERAIGNAAAATSVDFSYLLGQARIESGLNPAAAARTSSATGLFQFIEQSWLEQIGKHGAKYGLADASTAVRQTQGGRYHVDDPSVRQQILDLRKNPEIAAAMAAEYAASNRQLLSRELGREVQGVDLYLAHFLGTGGATKFLKLHDANPDAAAAQAFPAAARANRAIFYAADGQPRSLGDIRDRFAQKLGVTEGRPAAAQPVRHVQPADYLRIARTNAADTPQTMPQSAKLAYLMLASLGMSA
ncbi:MAG: lytic transglycosylase domain-containing protein [Parasphingorhabdus sp.]|nr:lytic transglycosylase domain-containing protein [Parasphingorhabdus sp.]